MPRGGLYERNPKAWFALRARLRAAGRWYGDQRSETAKGEPEAQIARAEGAVDVHTIPTAVTGELDEISLLDLLQDPDWGIHTCEYNVVDDTSRYENLHTPIPANMSILRVGPDQLSTCTVRDSPQNYQPKGAATSHLSGSKSLSVTVRNERAAENSKSIFAICAPCSHVHIWPISVYDTANETDTDDCTNCEIYQQLQRAHQVYYTKQRNVAISTEPVGEGDLQQNIRCHQERMACMGLYDHTDDGMANMLWMNESKFSDINDQEYSSILSRFQFFTSYALICAAQKKPFENMSTGCCNVDLAVNVFHTFMTVLKPEWSFATWENSKDNVLIYTYASSIRVELTLQKKAIEFTTIHRCYADNNQTRTNSFFHQPFSVLHERSHHCSIN